MQGYGCRKLPITCPFCLISIISLAVRLPSTLPPTIMPLDVASPLRCDVSQYEPVRFQYCLAYCARQPIMSLCLYVAFEITVDADNDSSFAVFFENIYANSSLQYRFRVNRTAVFPYFMTEDGACCISC